MKFSWMMVLALVVCLICLPLAADSERLVNTIDGEKSWFAYGDKLGKIMHITDKSDAKAQVFFGEQKIELTHGVEKVVGNDSHCIFVGEKRLTVVSFKPSVKIIFTRSFPAETDGSRVSIRVMNGKIVGCSRNSHVVWVWSMTGNTQWMLNQPPYASWMALPLFDSTIFVDDTGLRQADENGFHSIMNLNGRVKVPDFAYSENNQIVFLDGFHGIGVFKAEKNNDGVKVLPVQWYKPIFRDHSVIHPIKLGETCTFVVDTQDSRTLIFELDIRRECYRMVEGGRDVKASSLFLCGKNIYSSTNASIAPVVTEEMINKAGWIDLIKIPPEKW